MWSVELMKKISIWELIDESCLLFDKELWYQLTSDQIKSIKNKVSDLLPIWKNSDVDKVYLDSNMFENVNDQNINSLLVWDLFIDIIIWAFLIHLDNEKKYTKLDNINTKYMVNETRIRLMKSNN